MKIRTFSTALCFIMICLVLSSITFAQEKKKEDLKKKYADLVGDYKFNVQGREFTIAVYFEDGKLWSMPEFTDIPGEMEPIKGKELDFTVDIGGGTVDATFIKDEKGKITKCKIVHPAWEATGEKVIKEKKKDKK